MTADNQGRIETWDLVAKTRIAELQGPRKEGEDGWIPSLELLPDGRLLVAQHFKNEDETRVSIRSVDAPDDARPLFAFPGTLRELRVHAPSRRVLVASGALKVYDLDTGALLATFQGDADMFQFAITEDGKTILAGEIGGRVHILSVQF